MFSSEVWKHEKNSPPQSEKTLNPLFSPKNTDPPKLSQPIPPLQY